MNKQAKGITLIALVITIIVLLILAGVTILALLGDNGILTKAQLSKESTRGGEVKETVNLAISENKMASYTGGTIKTKEEVISELASNGKLTDDEVKELEETNVIKIGNVTVDFSGLVTTLVAMYNQAVADGCINEDGTCTNENHLHIGDYVNYPNPTSGTYKVESGTLGIDYEQRYDVSFNQLNWRVMGIDSSTGGIKIMASQPMKKTNSDGTGTNESDPYLHMSGAKAYINSLTELENICKMYTTSYGKARSINVDDIDELTGVTIDALKQKYGDTYGPFENQYTPESWLNNKTKTTVSGILTGYSYSVNSKSADDTLYVTMSNTRAYNMLFDNTEWTTGRIYWIGSIGVSVFSDHVYFGIGMLGVLSDIKCVCTNDLFDSRGSEAPAYAAVCPVVSLNSSVTKDEVLKVSDITESNWNYTGNVNMIVK